MRWPLPDGKVCAFFLHHCPQSPGPGWDHDTINHRMLGYKRNLEVLQPNTCILQVRKLRSGGRKGLVSQGAGPSLPHPAPPVGTYTSLFLPVLYLINVLPASVTPLELKCTPHNASSVFPQGAEHLPEISDSKKTAANKRLHQSYEQLSERV